MGNVEFWERGSARGRDAQCYKRGMVHWGENGRSAGGYFLISATGTPPLSLGRVGIRLILGVVIAESVAVVGQLSSEEQALA